MRTMNEGIRISQVRTDGGTQSRASLNADTVSEYSEKYAQGVRMPPVVVFHDGASYWLADGFHRVAGAYAARLAVIDADVRQGSQRDAILFSVGANDSHGLRRTNADKRRAVELLLRDEEWSKKSDRWIAEKCAVSDRFVNGLRKESTANRSQLGPRLGQDGKNRRVPKPRPDSIETQEEVVTEVQEKIRERLAAGGKVREIAEDLGVKAHHVQEARRTLGMTRRGKRADLAVGAFIGAEEWARALLRDRAWGDGCAGALADSIKTLQAALKELKAAVDHQEKKERSNVQANQSAAG